MNDDVKEAPSNQTMDQVADHCAEIHTNIYNENKHIIFKMSENQAQELDQAAMMYLDDIDTDIIRTGQFEKVSGKGFWPRKTRGPLLRYFVELLTYADRLDEASQQAIQPLFDLIDRYTRIRIEIHNARDEQEMEEHTKGFEDDYLLTLALRCEGERMEDPQNKSIMASNQLKSDYLLSAFEFSNRFLGSIEQRPTIFKDARKKAFVAPPIQSFADLIHLYLYPTLKDPINTAQKRKALDEIGQIMDIYSNWARLRREREVFTKTQKPGDQRWGRDR